jgi:hypothetical protein
MKRSLFAIAILPTLAALTGLPSVLHAADNQAWGNVKGQIIWGGDTVPERKKLDVTKDQEHCLGKGPIYSDEWVIDPKTRGVRWTFVWLVDAQAPNKPLPIHPKLKQIKNQQVELDQPTCRFVPHALGMRQGQELVAKNSAPIAHNIHWVGLKNPGGNVIVPTKQQHVISGLVADRFPVKVNCDIHPWMNAYVRVFNHPYFAVTGRDGTFQIKDAPAGTYRLMVWHDSGYGPGGNKGTEITIKSGETTDVGPLKMPAESK